MTLRIGVIGGGLGGLAASCVLASRGHGVTLFERTGSIGGVIAQVASHGFRFDGGPGLLTVPRVLERIFDQARCRLADRLELVRLDPQLRCFFDDGSTLDLVEDVAAMTRSIAALSTAGEADAQGYRDFLNLSARMARLEETASLWRPSASPRDLFDGAVIREAVCDLPALRLGQSAAGLVRDHVGDPRVAQLLDLFQRQLGSSPAFMPALLCARAHRQLEEGVWYPKGGLPAVAAALAALLRELGGEIRIAADIGRIEHDARKVTGLVTETGERIAVDAVVSSADVVRTHRDLLGGVGERFLRGRDDEPSCSALVLHLGLDQRYEQLTHHSFACSLDADEEWRSIYEAGEPAPDPTCYIAAPSVTEPGVAPPGGEALTVVVQVPYLRPHHDWRELLPTYRRVILDKLARSAGLHDLDQRIVVERHLTPQDLHDRYRLLNGAAYGLASHGRFLGACKPGNRSRQLAGLYLAGGSVHPGPGLPMALLSGWIAAEALDQDRRGGLLSAGAR
jgi:diapolycopene oxygenase